MWGDSQMLIRCYSCIVYCLRHLHGSNFLVLHAKVLLNGNFLRSSVTTFLPSTTCQMKWNEVFFAMCGIVQDRWNEINALRNYTLLNNFSRQSHDLCFLFVHKLQFQNLSSRPAFLVGGRIKSVYTLVCFRRAFRSCAFDWRFY